MYQIIYGRANPGEEDAGEKDGVIGDDYSSQFLNESGEGVQQEEISREEEVPLTNSGEVY